jgi:hypothetical protein
MRSVSSAVIRRVSILTAAVLCALSLTPSPVRADVPEADAISAGLVRPANAGLQEALHALRTDQVAQANPVGIPQAPLSAPALPQGFKYTVDVNMTWPYGNPGFNANLPGGIDATASYAFSRTNRLAVGYYELSEYPVGFSNVTVPFFLQGLAGPVGAASTGNFDATIKNKLFTAIDQNLIVIGHRVPIVISPTYLSRTGTVGGHSDEQLIEFNGFPTLVRLRTVQHYLIPVTLPFLSTPKMFGSVSVAPEWLVHLAGVNQTNHAQLFELAYLEYRANKRTTFYVQPSRLIDYLPSDPYPEYVPTVIAGVAYHFTPLTFVQMNAMTGAATNRSPYGVTALTCQRTPCSGNLVAPSLGGLHAAQVQVIFGIGSPSVLPL